MEGGCISGVGVFLRITIHLANTTTVFAVQNYLYRLLSALIAYIVDREQPIVIYGFVCTAA